ncbi:MAG: PDZ domain-containing protein [Armatimonadota bacterium]|nr:PDZ domain-containing protein [bacterium]
MHLVRSTMTMWAGDGSEDARKYMDSAVLPGVYEMDGITVRYPEGCAATAEEVARAFADTANDVAREMGIDWSFHLEIRLVRVPGSVKGLKYSVPLRRNRRLVFPVFLNEKGEVRADWAPTVAHEMTEASMIAPRDRHKMVLADTYGGPVCINAETRWFRDGVSNRAADVLGARLFLERYQPRFAGYAELNTTREAVLNWCNCEDQPNYYSAATALIREGELSAGDSAIARMMTGIAGEYVPGGRAVRRAFSSVTGKELPGYLRTYTTPWLGAEFTDTRPDSDNHPLILPGNEVVISSVHPATPAARWKMQPGDVIESFNNVQVCSAGQLDHLIAKCAAGEMVMIFIRRGNNVAALRVKLISRPRDMRRFTQLSLYVPGTVARRFCGEAPGVR